MAPEALRGLVRLRMMPGHIGVTVVPGQIAVSPALIAFCDAGVLTEKVAIRDAGGHYQTVIPED